MFDMRFVVPTLTARRRNIGKWSVIHIRHIKTAHADDNRVDDLVLKQVALRRAEQAYSIVGFRPLVVGGGSDWVTVLALLGVPNAFEELDDGMSCRATNQCVLT